jgi:hypothetical protein
MILKKRPARERGTSGPINNNPLEMADIDPCQHGLRPFGLLIGPALPQFRTHFGVRDFERPSASSIVNPDAAMDNASHFRQDRIAARWRCESMASSGT